MQEGDIDILSVVGKNRIMNPKGNAEELIQEVLTRPLNIMFN
ncbi:MAG: hypothetical protein QW385_04730 [Thermoproteota archaeon]